MTETEALAAYDEQLRTDAETPSATAVRLLGPLRLVTFAGGRGFITYRDLGGARPILERAGLVKVSTTTPYVWER